jgi:hypothetical protein
VTRIDRQAVVADRNERRNITKGQKAMAYAFYFFSCLAKSSILSL